MPCNCFNIKNHLEFLTDQNSILFENNIKFLKEVLLSLEKNEENNMKLIINAQKTISENIHYKNWLKMS